MNSQCNCTLRSSPINWAIQSQRLDQRFKNQGVVCHEDLRQETLGRGFEKCCLFDPSKSKQKELDDQVGAWLGGFATHVQQEYVNRRQFTELASEWIDQHSIPRPLYDHESIACAFRSVMSKLNPSDRETVLQYWKGSGVVCIARSLSIQPNTVHKRLGRFRESLAYELERLQIKGEFIEIVSSRTNAMELFIQLITQSRGFDRSHRDA